MRKLYLILFITSLFLETFGQDSQTANMNNENLFVHINRSEYVAGEKIWFKIIAFQKEKVKAATTSKLVYIEVINPQGFAIARKKIRMRESSGNGELQLPDTLTTGVYRVLAYTNWMKNLGYSSFFKTNFMVYNPLKPGVNKKPKTLSDFQISLEDNELVAELNNTIYYKLNSETFDTCSIVIKDSEGNLVKTQMIKEFYGGINFTPIKDKRYLISLITNKDTISVKELPNSQAEGIIINLEKVSTKNANFKVQSTPLYQSLVKEIEYTLNNSKTSNKLDLISKSNIEIKSSSLKNGKNKITFYKFDKSVISERYFYFEDEKLQAVEIIGAENGSFNKRLKAKAKIRTLSTTDFGNVNLSISVIKIPKRINLKNDVYETSSSCPDMFSLNIFQLFEQSNSEDKKTNSHYPEIMGALLTGKIITQDGSPLSENDIFLSFPDSVIRLTITKTNKDGEFVFFVNSDEIERDIVINSNNNNKNLTILIDDNFYNNYPIEQIALNNVHEDYLNELFVNYRINTLYEIENTKNREDSLALNHNYSFYEKPNEVYDFNDYVKLDSIQEYFYEIVQGVRISRNKKKWSVEIVDATKDVIYNNNPALFIDGVYFENIKSLLKLDPKDCLGIEVIRKPVMLRNRNYEGLIAIFTKDYNLNGVDLPSNSTRIEYKISDKSLEFLSKPTIEKEMPDFRNTLYWNPEIALKKGEETEVEFYTGDDNSWYKIEIKGITDTGIEVSEHKIFKVGKIE
jgi:hypothetical protein